MSSTDVITPLSDHLPAHSQQLMASIEGIFWEADLQTLQFSYVSAQAERILGYPRAMWLAPDFWVAHMHPDDRAWATAFCATATREGRNHHFEYRMIAADGRVVWLRDMVSLVYEAGKATKLCGIMIDVTDRKRAEDAFSAAQKQLFTLTDNFPDPLARFDRQGCFLYTNSAAERAFGRPLEAVVGKTLHELQFGSPAQCDELTAAIQQVFADGTANILETMVYTAFGPRLTEVRHIPEFDENGTVISVLGIMRDVTAQRQVEEDRKAHLWFLESLDKVNRAIQGAGDLEQMMNDVLDAVLAIFTCDRAWLLCSHDPTSEQWRPPIERAKAGYPCTYDRKFAVLAYPELRTIFQIADAADGPVIFAPGEVHELSAAMRTHLGVQSTLLMALYPKGDTPYLFGLHQCSYRRAWTPQDERLLQEIGRRLSDALTSILAYRRLRESEGRYREIFENASDLIVLVDISTDDRLQLRDVNPAWEALMGIDRTQVMGRYLEDFSSQPTVNNLLPYYYRAIQLKTQIQFENQVTTATGQWYIHTGLVPILNAEGKVYRVVGIGRNITEQKAVEGELRTAEARFRIFVEHATDAFFLHDESGKILDVNQQACTSLGYTRDELLGMSPVQFDPSLRTNQLHQLYNQLSSGEVFTFERNHYCKDGSCFPVEISIRAFSIGEARFAISLARDIRERKRTEQALIESHNLLRAVVDGTNDSVFVKDRQGRYLLINQAGAQLLGHRVEEVIGKDDFALFGQQVAARLRSMDQHVMEAAELYTVEETESNVPEPRTFLTAKNVFRDAGGAVIGLIGVSRDITDLKRLESQLRQAQKMDALGRLAGGVAHDFNNLLTVISGYSQILDKRLGADSHGSHLLAEIMKASNRASELTRQLLAFSRKQALQPQVINLNQLLTDLTAMLRRLIGENIELAFQPAPSLGMVKIDPSQFEQAIINLAVNARDAMPQGGQLLIDTYTVLIKSDHNAQHPDLHCGLYACVRVRDTGEGMDEATKARLFEPFFTTKALGKGTGLGLAMVYGFIKQSGGQIEVTSAPGHGATFTSYFPIVDDKPPVVAAVQNTAATHGSETVLIVEDETSVRELVSAILTQHGYQVLEADGPQRALDLATAYRETIDLLVTDIVMPFMDGRQLSEQLAAVRTDLKVLYMSGYTESAVAKHKLVGHETAFLQKPFTIDGLLQKVRLLLEA
jgi:PAS domain S-box-containing protein